MADTVLTHFAEQGYVVIQGLLDPKQDLQPVIDEYDHLLDRLAHEWAATGKISSPHGGLPFRKRLCQIALETDGAYFSHFDITLPLSNIRPESPIHLGPAVFNLLRNSKLLDGVERFIGPEIYLNPVQHARIKPPQRLLSEPKRYGTNPGVTPWHQDRAAPDDSAADSDILTVWLPITDATEENGCLAVIPGSHKCGELVMHCSSATRQGIPTELLGGEPLPLPMRAGDVLFMNKFTKHCSLPNVSDEIRWSFDLRYNPIGQRSGRDKFPGFVARSRANPASELHDPQVWAQSWRDAAVRLAGQTIPAAVRPWDPNHALCA
jgi:hypothetical protein